MWYGLLAAVIVLVIGADQFSKWLVVRGMYDGQVSVIPHVLRFTYVENEGMAFGLLADHRWVFLVFSTVAIVGILAYLFVKRPQSRMFCFSLALIAGGGVGNMIERLAHGYVTDFINPTFVDFYVFNVADSCVTVGCCLLILWLIVDTVREAKAKKLAATGEGDPADGGAAGDPKLADAAKANEAEDAGKTTESENAEEAADNREGNTDGGSDASSDDANGAGNE